jgi:hypothetical protein
MSFSHWRWQRSTFGSSFSLRLGGAIRPGRMTGSCTHLADRKRQVEAIFAVIGV